MALSSNESVDVNVSGCVIQEIEQVKVVVVRTAAVVVAGDRAHCYTLRTLSTFVLVTLLSALSLLKHAHTTRVRDRDAK